MPTKWILYLLIIAKFSSNQIYGCPIIFKWCDCLFIYKTTQCIKLKFGFSNTLYCFEPLDPTILIGAIFQIFSIRNKNSTFGRSENCSWILKKGRLDGRISKEKVMLTEHNIEGQKLQTESMCCTLLKRGTVDNNYWNSC